VAETRRKQAFNEKKKHKQEFKAAETRQKQATIALENLKKLTKHLEQERLNVNNIFSKNVQRLRRRLNL
jgi:hypothetical protein